MTAPALAHPSIDTDFDSDFVARRPQLRLIEGGRGQRQGAVPQARPLAGVLGQEPSAAGPSIEIVRRRRFLALLAVTMLVVAVAWAAGVSVLSFGAIAVDPVADGIPAVHTVMPGDSYAAIAADLGAANPIAAGEELRAANGGAELIIGQRLVVDPVTLTAAG